MSLAIDDAAPLINHQPVELVEELLAEAEASLDQAYQEARRARGSDRAGCVKAIALLAEAVLATGETDYQMLVQGLLSEVESARQRFEPGLGSANRYLALNQVHRKFLELHVSNGRRERAAPGGNSFISSALGLAGEIAAGLDVAHGNLLRGQA